MLNTLQCEMGYLLFRLGGYLKYSFNEKKKGTKLYWLTLAFFLRVFFSFGFSGTSMLLHLSFYL